MATITRTAKELVRKSLRKIHVVGQGQTLEAEQENDAFSDLNEMLAMWSVDGFMIPSIVQESFSLVAGTASYAIGTGATWNTDRPKAIVGGFVRVGSTDYPITPMSRQAYNSIDLKATSSYPSQFYYRDTYPNGVVYFDYTPSTSDTVYLELQKPLGEIATINTTVSLPPEYFECIWSNLCIRLAPEYETDVPREVAMLAERSMDIIKARNFSEQIPDARFDSAISHRNERFNIDGGW